MVFAFLLSASLWRRHAWVLWAAAVRRQETGPRTTDLCGPCLTPTRARTRMRLAVKAKDVRPLWQALLIVDEECGKRASGDVGNRVTDDQC
jgi:hypothetical protein